MNELKELCKVLHLAYLPEAMREVEWTDPETYLCDLLRREVQGRREAKVARLLKKAKFRDHKDLASYEWTDTLHFPHTLNEQTLMALGFIERCENLLMMGGSGTGKTHLATALGRKACAEGYHVRFFQVADLVSQLESHFRAGTLTRFKRGMEACDVLILDELGYVPFQKEGAELLFHLITDCYERKSVIITSNLEFGQWNRVFGDNRLTAALVDRLVHHAHILAFKGDSYRLKYALSHLKMENPS